MASIKISDVVVKFTGSQNEDINEWLKKVELVATLQNVEDLSKFIPLFLEKAAFAVYDQLPVEKKANYDEIKKSLLSSFSLTPYQAFAEFKERSLRNGETADAFLADLRRFLAIIGTSDEKLLQCQFVEGLPPDVGAQVKALTSQDSGIATILTCAKAIMANRKTFDFVGAIRPKKQSGRPFQDGRQGDPPGSGVQCAGCHRFGHSQRTCRTKCYRCQELGHLARECPQGDDTNSGNAKREVSAAADASRNA